MLDLTAGLAALPAQPYLGAPPRRVAMLGMVLNGMPRRNNSRGADSASDDVIESVRQDSTRVLVRLRIPHAKQVELSGEPTSWTPVTMRRVQGDWWEAHLNARPGSYRMNIRVDGRQWIAPPGTVTSRDEFGGEVGVIHIR
jgi:hypothetical protein